MGQRALRLVASLAGVAMVTFVAYRLIPVNTTTVGFAYLLLVLVIASTWGFAEAALASFTGTLAFNFFFLPPIGTFTIADPQNWVALFSFLTTSLIASRLSAMAKRRELDAIEHQQDIERLYTFSRAILLIHQGEPFAKRLSERLAEAFTLNSVALYDRRTGEICRAGPGEFEGLEHQLREVAVHGASVANPERNRMITAVRLGSEPIASLAVEGRQIPDFVLQGIGNLVAIGLERARAQDLAGQIEAARQSEQLRTTLIDAMAHEFKTPLTSIKAAATSLLASPNQPVESRIELLTIANEEADHLKELIDESIDMARLDTGIIEVDLEIANLGEIVGEVIRSMQTGIEHRALECTCDPELPPIAFDRRLVKLAIKQLVDNALKYSPPETPVWIQLQKGAGNVSVEIRNGGDSIPVEEQNRIFERFYRSPSVKHQIPGSGLGLSIAHSIARAHQGDLTVSSHPGETIFRMTLPANSEGEQS